MWHLTIDDVAFAQAHVRRFYTSDFFPDPDELAAIWLGWPDVTDRLTKTPLADLGSLAMELAASKATGGYRIVHQLDPLDALAYTAAVHRIAPVLEERRSPLAEGIVCSYRIAVDTKSGQFFPPEDGGYALYRMRSDALSRSRSHVLVLDIAGFYNHIYLHRIQGCIEQLDPALQSISLGLERFLLNVNKNVSIGLPIGPAASIVLSEVILHDIDTFVSTHLRRGMEYTRYADDYRIFSNSRIDLEAFWHEITRFLYRAHRLSLSGLKSRLIGAMEFRAGYVDESPAWVEPQRLTASATANIASLAGHYGQPEERDRSTTATPTARATKPDGDRESVREQAAALLATFQRILDIRPLPLGAARRVLRLARRNRIRVLIGPVLDEIENLSPVIRDAALYLAKVLSPNAVLRNRAPIERMFNREATYRTGLLVHEWMAWLASDSRALATLPAARSFIQTSPPRFHARHAAAVGLHSWVREHQAEWTSWAGRDRWALLLAGRILPAAERRVWMDAVIASGGVNPTDALVARYVKVL